MRILLDSHVVLWWFEDSPKLSDDVKDLIDSEEQTYVSPATLWELELKRNIGKFAALPDLLPRLRSSELRELRITWTHGDEAGRLPLHHRDPFDRMLVAQARCEGLTLVTHDKHIQEYDVPLLVV